MNCNAQKYFTHKYPKKNENIDDRAFDESHCRRGEKDFVKEHRIEEKDRKNFAEKAPIIVQEVTYFECDICKKTFQRKNYLRRHLRTLHPNNLPSRQCVGEDVRESFLFVCHYCGTKYSRKDYLIPHIKAKHLSLQPTIYECRPCGLAWTTKESQRRHIQKVHSSDEQMTDKKVPKTTRLRCPLCGVSFTQKIKLISHFEDRHHIEIETENLRFSSEEEFFAWKRTMETNMYCRFRKRCYHKNKEHGFTLFTCHRSGTYHSRAHIRRSFKGKKLNAFCPAQIKFYNKQGSFDVVFVKTHVGHSIGTEEEISHISHISERDRKRILYRIKAGIPVETGLEVDEELSYNNSNPSKGRVLSNEDLCGKSIPDNLNTDSSANILDVDKFIARNVSSVLYYKKAGTLDSNCPSLNKEDTVIIFLNTKQEEMLRQFGHDVIAIDCVNSPINTGFTLLTLLVIDEFRESYPAAFAIGNKNNQLLIDIFLHCLKEHVGPLQPNILMTELTDTHYNHWIDIMSEPSKRIYCPWFVREDWNKNLMLISNAEVRDNLMKELTAACMEPDEAKFQEKVVIIFSESGEDIAQFISYFCSNYLDNIEAWAYCYQIRDGIPSNMYVSSFKKYEKHRMGVVWSLRSLEFVLQNIEKQLIRSDVDLKRTEAAVKLTEKLKTLRGRHDLLEVNRTGESLNKFVMESDVPEKWHVSWFSSEDEGALEPFVVTQVIQDACENCPLVCDRCGICSHQFRCTCDDSSIGFNMCKHVHLLGMYLTENSHADVLPVDGANAEFILDGTSSPESFDYELISCEKASVSAVTAECSIPISFEVVSDSGGLGDKELV